MRLQVRLLLLTAEQSLHLAKVELQSRRVRVDCYMATFVWRTRMVRLYRVEMEALPFISPLLIKKPLSTEAQSSAAVMERVTR